MSTNRVLIIWLIGDACGLIAGQITASPPTLGSVITVLGVGVIGTIASLLVREF